MLKTWILGLGLTLSAGLAVTPAVAQDEEGDAECVAACREALGDCRFDAREAAAACLEEAGCDVLRDEYREVCLTADRDDEACSAARTAYRDCVEPCHEARHDDAEACRESIEACLLDECGIEAPARRPRRHGRRGPRGRH
jgi:hypothetical protein